MKIESSDKDIESLLGSSYFHIPRFQRPYSWDDENIKDFWDDIYSNQSEDYFIGSMVVYKNAKQEFGVVDGQQRLTTITILLCVIRDAFLELECEGYAKGVHQLIERKDRGNKNRYVLKTETSFPYFQENIQKYDEDPDAEFQILEEEQSLKRAHEQFAALVTGVLDLIDKTTSISKKNKSKRKIERLVSIRDSVLNLNTILIVLDNEDDAYIIFETLNTRGKDLALSDLVKNHFSKYLKASGDVDHAGLKWKSVLETIHNSSADISTDTFIYHYWASRYDAISQKKLFGKFKKSVTKTKSKAYLDELVSDSSLYRSLHEPNYGWKQNEREAAVSLESMQMFKLSQPTPATLSLCRAYKDNVIKYKKFRDTIRAIEKFHFQFTAVTSSRSSGGISAMYSSFAQKLFSCSDSNSAAREIAELITKLRDRTPSYDEFSVAFREINYTNSNSKQKALVQYILREFSRYYKYKTPVDFDELTIEHIHPQSKSSDKWTDNVIGSLGNLIYVDSKINGLMSSKPYAEKKKILKDEKYTIPEFLEGRQTWTPAAVLAHTNNMSETAYNKIWKV